MTNTMGVIVTLWSACAACVAYTYIIYPIALALVARLRPRPVRWADRPPLSVSIVLAAYNEQATMDRRLRELTAILAAWEFEGEIVVVSDGSTDHTVELARAHSGERVHVVALPENRGKAVALTAGCAMARHEIVVFADARQSWDADALQSLLRNFADPDVGAVSGELVLESAPGVMAGIGLYWRFEKWLRCTESLVYSMVGVTGAISAVRRELFRPIPPGTILDDVYWPLAVAMQRYRVVFEGRAHAYDRLPERVHDEFRRKVRTLSGNFQLMALLPATLSPRCNPIWLQFYSHKLLRLAVPWALLGLLATSAALEGVIYRVVFVAQIVGYALGLAGLHRAISARSRVAAAAASFLVLNAAAWVAFWVAVTGRAARSWGKVSYQVPAVNLSADRENAISRH